MGKVLQFPQRGGRGPTKPPPRSGARFVTCTQCGERHPIIRHGDGSERCVTAFVAEDRWFCRHRGCHAAWLARQPKPDA